MLLSILIVCISVDQDKCIVFNIKIILKSDNFMLLRIVDTSFEENGQKFELFTLLLQLGSFYGTSRFHQLVEFAGAVWVVFFFLFFWRRTIWWIEVL